MKISFTGIKLSATANDRSQIEFKTYNNNSQVDIKRNDKGQLFLQAYEFEPDTYRPTKSLIGDSLEPIEIESHDNGDLHIYNGIIDNGSILSITNLEDGDLRIERLREAVVKANNSKLNIRESIDSKINDYAISGKDLRIETPSVCEI